MWWSRIHTSALSPTVIATAYFAIPLTVKACAFTFGGCDGFGAWRELGEGRDGAGLTWIGDVRAMRVVGGFAGFAEMRMGGLGGFGGMSEGVGGSIARLAVVATSFTRG